MSRDPELLEKIFAITRGDLEDAEMPFPPFDSGGAAFYFSRILRLAAFWRDDTESRQSLERSFEDFVTGLHSQGLPWALLIEGTPRAVKVQVGAPTPASVGVIVSSLRGTLPDVRLDERGEQRSQDLAKLRCASQVTGCPTSKGDPGRDLAGYEIERVCRGLYGETWAYLVSADPVPTPEVALAINRLAEEIRVVHQTVLLQASGTDDRHRLAREYLTLLEAKLKRLNRGRATGMWNARAFLLSENADVMKRGAALLASAFSGEQSVPDRLRVRPCRPGATLSRPAEALSSGELAILAVCPREEYPGYELAESTRFGVVIGNTHTAPVVKIGEILDRGRSTGNTFQIARDDLTRHGIVVGVTGSGKTNTCLGLLEQVWDSGRGVPFLVIESVKSEYRALARRPDLSNLRVFTIGNETVSPFRLNPFEVPRGILLQTHIDYLKALFVASFVLYPPMPYVLEQSLQEIYEERGWDLAWNRNRRGVGAPRSFPTLADLHMKVALVIERMGYDDQITMNVRSGLQARIGQLRIGGGKGLMLDTRHSIPMEDLFDRPCVLELKGLVSDDEKAFVMGLILIRLAERYESGRLPPASGLRHLTLIEEAHRLLRNIPSGQVSEVAANPRGYAVEVFSSLLAEIRAYGEGILMAEQVPAKLTPDAIKNTNLKIVHRLLASDDRRTVGDTMGLTDAQSRYLATLPTGEAIAFAEGMRKAVLVSVPAGQANGRSAPTDAELARLMAPFLQAHSDLRLRFPGCARCLQERGAPSASCGRADELFDSAVARVAMGRFLSTMRHHPAFVLEAYAELELVMRRFLPTDDGAGLYCRAVQFIEHDMEGRAHLHRWRFADLATAIDLATGVTWTLTRSDGTLPQVQLEQQVAQDLGQLAGLTETLCRVDNGPFAGCSACTARCQYRHETLQVPHRYEEDFRAAFDDPASNLKDLADVCWRAAHFASIRSDIRGLRSAATCFAAHRLGATGLSSRRQEEIASELRGLLEQHQGEHDVRT